jgi:hypothetical protein
LLRSDEFEIAYNAATPKRRVYVRNLIDRGQKESVRNFVKEEMLSLTPFHRMNVKRLRKMGQRLGVRDYNSLNKRTLVEEIQLEIDRIKEGVERVTLQSKEHGASAAHSGEDRDPGVLADKSDGDDRGVKGVGHRH